MSCSSDSDCPFLFECTQQLRCQHVSVFPLNIYSSLVYIVLIPLACGLVNATGHSMGVFKVLIVMNILRYKGSQATMVTQALVFGAAIPNFVSVLMRRHPTKITSLVNFNLIYILIPCSLLGSTLGSLITGLIPEIGSDILILILFSFFTNKFLNKFKSLLQKEKISKQIEKNKSIITEQENKLTHTVISEDIIVNQQSLIVQSQKLNDNKLDFHQKLLAQSITQTQLAFNPILHEQRQKLLKYERSIHLKDILLSFVVFLIFEFVVFLVQGQLPFLKYSHCSLPYYLGIGALFVLTLCYLKLIHLYIIKKFTNYFNLSYSQDLNLLDQSLFKKVMFGGLTAGLVQGILGLGSGTTTMAVLLDLGVDPISASATVGYQILFIGGAALIQGFINGQVKPLDSSFFVGVTALLGGVVHFAIVYYLKDKDKVKVDKIVLFIMMSLCLISILMVFPDAILNYLEFGWDSMVSIKFTC